MYRLFFPLKGPELGWFFRKAKYHPLQEYLFEIFFFSPEGKIFLESQRSARAVPTHDDIYCWEGVKDDLPPPSLFLCETGSIFHRKEDLEASKNRGVMQSNPHRGGTLGTLWQML